jgi:hypothetical protein
MNQESTESILIKGLMVMMCTLTLSLGLHYTYSSGMGWSANLLLFPWCHANFFHWAGNMTVATLCIQYSPRRFLFALVLALACACACLTPTEGLSGLLFAYIGQWYGEKRKNDDMCIVSVFALVTGLLPHVALYYHLLTLVSGYAVGLVYHTAVACRRK